MIAITVDEDGEVRLEKVTESDVEQMRSDGVQFVELEAVGPDPMYWASKARLGECTVCVLVI